MKLNVLLLIAMIILSCDNKTKEKEVKYIYAQQTFYSSAVAETNTLTQRQEEITIEIDSGNTDEQLANEFEMNAQRIENLQNLSEVLLGLVPSIGPIGPIPMPPEPCLDTSNCAPLQNLTDIKGMVLHNEIEITNTTLYNNEVNDVVGFESFPGDLFLNQEVLLLEANFTNITKMNFTVSVDGINEITIHVPITIN